MTFSRAAKEEIIVPFCISVRKWRVLDVCATNFPSCEQLLMVEKSSFEDIPEGDCLKKYMLGVFVPRSMETMWSA